MAHFAEIKDGIVQRVIVVNDSDCLLDGVEDEKVGSEFCHNLLGGEWVQTSYNTQGGINNRTGKEIKKNFAGVGYTYDKARDAFIAPKQFDSWVLDEATCCHEAPVERPKDGKDYQWDEAKVEWAEVAVVETPLIHQEI